jgi:hypothetical protein
VDSFRLFWALPLTEIADRSVFLAVDLEPFCLIVSDEFGEQPFDVNIVTRENPHLDRERLPLENPVRRLLGLGELI